MLSRILCSLLFIYTFTLKSTFESTINIDKKITILEKNLKKEKNALNSLEAKLKKLKKIDSSTSDKLEGKVFYDLGSGTGKNVILAYLFEQNNNNSAINFIETNYENITAEISDEESEQMIKDKGAPLYGEIKPKSFIEVLQDPNLNIKHFSKAVGIELSPSRYSIAKKMKNKLFKENLEIPKKTLQFRKENFLESDISDADVVYIAIYDEKLMDGLTKKLSKLKDGLFVITLKELPNDINCGFKQLKEFSLPMTWSEGSPVYIYKLNKSEIKPECYKEFEPVESSID